MRLAAPLLLLLASAPLMAGGLAVSAITVREAAPPALPLPLRVFVVNRGVETSGAVVTVRAPYGFGTVPSFCSVMDEVATCRVGATEEVEFFALKVYAPDASDSSFDIELAIETDEGGEANRFTFTGRTYRTFFVTNAEDEGSGSLRAAIEAANASCFDETPCLIAFRIPSSVERWHTIRLESPLPVVGGLRLEIDASLQAAYFSDTNDAGPEVELTGESLGEGDGLVITTPCTSAVRGLAINDFPRLGILLVSTDCPLWPEHPFLVSREIAGNHIGADPTGSNAGPNMRGVHVGGSGGWNIRENVISGNRASGVFLESGVNVVTRNIIGLDRDLTGPLSNGGSGVWIGHEARGSSVDHNMIGFNQHAGVAIDRDAFAVSVYGNSLQANYHRAIDWGLDGAASGPVPIPEITSVRVEEGVTIVEGLVGAHGGTFPPVVQIYANDAPDPSGYGEGQYWLGFTRAAGGAFRFELQSDLTGKWIAVTSTREDYGGWARPPQPQTHFDTGWGFLTTTSEFSRAVEVR